MKKYRALLRVQGKCIHCGYFENPLDAAAAYDTEALNHFGSFATTNFPNASIYGPLPGGLESVSHDTLNREPVLSRVHRAVCAALKLQDGHV